MKLGFMLLPRSLDETRELARKGSEMGFHWISVADSPTVYQDSYLHQLEVARAAENVTIGPMVSHLVARHPVIVANQLATLNEFTGGRVIGTIGTGNSAARGLGKKPATVIELKQGIEAIQAYWRGDRAELGDGGFIPATGIQRQRMPAAGVGRRAAGRLRLGPGRRRPALRRHDGSRGPAAAPGHASPRAGRPGSRRRCRWAPTTTRSATTSARWWWRWPTGRCAAT